MKPPIHVKGEHSPICRLLLIDKVELEKVHQKGSQDLHLSVSKLFTQANPGPGLKCSELERTFWSEDSVFQPPLRMKRLCIISPYVGHPSHGISQVVDTISLLDFEAIR